MAFESPSRVSGTGSRSCTSLYTLTMALGRAPPRMAPPQRFLNFCASSDPATPTINRGTIYPLPCAYPGGRTAVGRWDSPSRRKARAARKLSKADWTLSDQSSVPTTPPRRPYHTSRRTPLASAPSVSLGSSWRVGIVLANILASWLTQLAHWQKKTPAKPATSFYLGLPTSTPSPTLPSAYSGRMPATWRHGKNRGLGIGS